MENKEEIVREARELLYLVEAREFLYLVRAILSDLDRSLDIGNDNVDRALELVLDAEHELSAAHFEGED